MSDTKQCNRNRKSVDIPVALSERIQSYAKQNDCSVSEVLRRGADRLLKQEALREQGYQVGAFIEEDGKVVRAYLHD